MKAIGKWICVISLGILTAISIITPLRAAETLSVVYGPLKQSVKITSLERFVETGEVNKELEFYFNSFSLEQREVFRKILVQKVPIEPVPLSHFLNSRIGNDVLERFGRIITLPGGANGKYSLRGSIVEAALDPEGLTILNVLRKFSTDIQINGEALIRVNKSIDLFFQSTDEATQNLQNLAKSEATQEKPVNYAKMPDLAKPGPYKYSQQTLKFWDKSRKRYFYTIIYRPKVPPKQKIPVVIVSHGLASRPEDFSSVATTLASYGFLVALPQHLGSDLKQAKALLEGYTSQMFDGQEFINRPKDISFVINELELRNQREYQGRLNLKQVGVIGHSYGGYTALAVGGAQIDFENLQKNCDQFNYVNLSLLVQCRALDLKRQNYQFRDPRVRAIMARNPLDSSIFGQRGLEQIAIPTFLLAGSYDLATPVVFEQMFSFPWLTKAPASYLGLIEGQAHVDFSQLDAGVTSLVNSLFNLNLPSPELINIYSDAISVAFFKVYIAGDKKYLPYLQPSYPIYLSRNESFKFSILTKKSQGAVADEVQKIKDRFALEQQ